MSLNEKFRIITKMNNLGLLTTIVLIIIGMAIFFPRFLLPINIEILGMGFVQEAIMALGMTLIIISAGIDLSIAGTMAFSAIMVGIFLNNNFGIAVSILLALLLSALVGFVNAQMINHLKVHPFICTLATLTTLKGINLVITKGETVAGFPPAFYFFGQGRVFGIPFPIFLFAVMAIVFAYLLKNHKYFQQVYFIGGNIDSARYSGINIDRFIIFIYVLNSILAGIAGIITASQYISANTGFGIGIELRVITAVIIGGVSLSGGKGNIGGTILGILFLAIINNTFVQTGAPTYWQEVVYGSMLLIAVFLEEYIGLKREGTGALKRWSEFLL